MCPAGRIGPEIQINMHTQQKMTAGQHKSSSLIGYGRHYGLTMRQPFEVTWEMSPCACATASVRSGEKCGDEHGEHDKERM